MAPSLHSLMHNISDRHYSNNNWRFFGCLLLLVALLARSWQMFTNTTLLVEDAQLFSRYYGNAQPFKDVAENHLDQPYSTLVSNIFAWAIAFVDVRLQPLLYEMIGFVWGFAAACCLFFSGLVRSKVVLLVGPLLIGLTALNHIFYYTTIIYIMYNAVIILLVLLFYPGPENRFSLAVLFPLFLVLPWAGPYSVLVIPAAIAMAVLYPRCHTKNALLFCAIISTIGYYLTVEGKTTMLVHLNRWWVIKHYFQVLLEQIVLMNQFEGVASWLWIPVLLLLGMCFFFLRRDRQFIKNSLVMLAISGGSLALFYLSIKFPLYRHPSDCHRVISSFFWCFFLLYAADRLFLTYQCHKSTFILFSCMIPALVLTDNIRYPRRYQYRTTPRTFAFVAAIHKVEQLHLEESNRFVVFRLIDNPERPGFIAEIRVGSPDIGAKRMMPEDLPSACRTPFVVGN